MKPRNYSSEGVVLARRNFGEADRILVVFSKHFGKLSLLAKGVRKPKSKKRGHIEIFSQFRFSANRGKGLDIITEVEIINSQQNLRKDLKKVAVCYFLMEAVAKVTHDEERNLNLYQLIIDSINKLQETNNLKGLRKDYIYKLLTSLGYWPIEKVMSDPDKELEKVIERKLYSIRVGRKILEKAS
ncbi:MAG: repair protein RecO, DNA repair protein RecO (recombination protein O) protein [Microgenomates group bacterium GW2011_GWC1_37_8]|uniref:DNA repair protein RecO n=1 Tax=Candidatus Woesebacteria bacterium GW2011_GWB1_38_8 TaxID=1618570 RepID=A0A0G0L3W8_9BACT|nr:MAG: repair protein RecO, DNA repair protein RecO (recombination protein O) protein [Microgenomates group bacterium GW2011_GWC1_37_8]KKQ85702.1 MAG: repair protein RecO protein [Candidatus Woesebacteria bacterium GW2011_GWB1_38_8]